MKSFFRRATALTVAVLLLTTPTAWASVALGDDLQSVTLPLADGVSLTYDRFWSNAYQDLRTEQYFTYTPQSSTSPLVYYGSTISSTNTLSQMASAIESTGQRVVSGINGDFYVVATGMPLGLVITDGVLRSSAAEHYGVGFAEDGTAFIGQPQLSITATFRDHSLIVSTLNKSALTTGGYQLFTSDFGTSVSGGAVAVVLTPITDGLGSTVDTDLTIDTVVDEDGTLVEDASEIIDTVVLSDQLGIGRRVTYQVDQVLVGASSVTIPTGSVVMTIGTDSNEWLISELAAVEVGSSLDVDITSADDLWDSAYTALGGLYLLVEDGVAQSGFAVEMAPRTAVGIKADGSVLFYTIDGRISEHSVGATLNQVAQRLVELGCVTAIALDGGGSTMVGTTMPDEDNMSIINVPSDGSERKVTNGLFLVTNTVATGVADHYYVSPYDAILLSGATLQLTASGVDSGWYPLDSVVAPSDWSVTAGSGSVSGSGLFTAPSTSGSTTVTAQNGSISGSATVTTVSTPDDITLYNEETGASVTTLALSPGDTVALTASARYRYLPLTSNDTNFTWSVSNGVGTVDSDGTFTASSSSATGQLTVSAGGFSYSIDVSVSGHLLPLEDFEGDSLTSFVGTNSTSVSLSTAQVKYGFSSLRLEYDTGILGYATAPAFLTMPVGEQYLNGWIYGDGSGNTLTATIADSTGATRDVVLVTLSFTGWQYFSAPLPSDSSGLSALSVVDNGTSSTGTLWLDQLTTSTEQLQDSEAPTIVIDVADDGTIVASVNDNYVSSFDQSQISISWDGDPLSFTWDVDSAMAYTQLPSYDDGIHRLTVTATDASGNIGRQSMDFSAGTTQSPFSDTVDHWALSYISYLYDAGITNGVATDSGVEFQPDKNITRGEFSLMVARWLGVNVDDYSNVVLPFDDVDDIPDWALNGVKAMYDLGLMMGSQDGTSLNANASSSISRAQAMTILGRIQPKGYETAEMTFSDAGDVPSWALEYVQSLVSQGVISGYDNQIKANDSIKRGEVAKILFTIQ